MSNLRKLFPIIRTKEELLTDINKSSTLHSLFLTWTEDQQQEFLDFCTGVRGIKLLYDSFFKEIFNPEYTPERLETILSLIIGKKVHILYVLPNDSTRLADEVSLLITDIVVEFEDHSIANVEIQKVGYLFPGQRCACYSADLLLRQYKRLRSKKKKKFSYKDVKNVYTIIFFEKSSKEFHEFPHCYLHTFSQTSNSGLKLEFLQKYYLIPLDIFQKNIHNNIRNELDAWLTFLTSDKPEIIESLIKQFPQFKVMYQELYQICLNVERVMHMFSKELLELDRNTVQYMIDIMQDEIDQQKEQLSQQNEQLSQQAKQLLDKDKQLLHMASLNQLTELLLRDNRIDDLQQAISDSEFRNILITEYQLNM